MRQVGVQVQDIGSDLCWQTYVDDPGKDLGLAKLIHIAKSPDYDNIPKSPDLIPNPEIIESSHPFTIPFITQDGADKDEPFENGREVDREVGETDGDFIAYQFDVRGILPPKSDYVFDSRAIDYQGQTLQISLLSEPWNELDPNGAPKQPPYDFKINLDSVNFQGKDSLNVNFVFKWKPSQSLLDQVKTQNDKNLAQSNAQKELEFRKTFVQNIKDRVKLASSIQQRPSEELREEERIVVYRRLIQEMLSNGIATPDDRTRHVIAELLNAIFDVDKMLYFVAPEWWRPRLHQSSQQLQPLEQTKPIITKVQVAAQNAHAAVVQNAVLGSQSAAADFTTPTLTSSTVGWGDINEASRDNYFITEDSEPARLGSSLGWLMQLDGDNMRNAFLNAPWVKAVIPIRPGERRGCDQLAQGRGRLQRDRPN